MAGDLGDGKPLSSLKISGILLAAGASRRLGSPKALLTTATGQPLVATMAEHLLHGGCVRVCVVLGAEAQAVGNALAPLRSGFGDRLQTLQHEDWAEGMGSSLAAGVRLVASADAEAGALLLATCDMPTVTSAHLEALAAAWRAAPSARVASGWTSPEGQPVLGVPAVLPRADWPALAALRGDEGARSLLRQPGTGIVSLAGGHLDLDTAADVARWRASWESAPPEPQRPSP